MQLRKNTLATKLILYNLLFSSCLTLILTSIQIYFDFKTELNESKSQFVLIENGFVNGLSSAIWFFDEKQIQNHIDGILKIADVAELNLQINESPRQYKNPKYSPNGPMANFNLIYSHEGNLKKLGHLEVILTLDKVYSKLEKKFIIVLLSNGIKTFLVSYFIFVLFYRLISEPLEKISNSAREISYKQLDRLSTEEREKVKPFDPPVNVNELEMVKNAISQMQTNFNFSYDSLKDNESRLSDIVELTSDIIFETDADFNLTFVNKKKGTENCFLDSIIVGSNLFELNIDEISNKVLRDKRKDLENNNELKSFVFDIGNKDGVKSYALSMRSFYYNYSHYIHGYRGVLIDVTARREYERQIEEQKEHIKQIQKMDAIGELTAGIAHDFNNVLSVISGSLKNISRLEIDHDGLNKYLIKAINATDRGTKLSKRLLSFSRRQVADEKAININESIESMVDILSVALSASTVVNKDFSPDIWKIKVDVNMLENVLINMCVNARDAMLKTATPTMNFKTRNVIHQSKEMVLIELSDNGEGIPQEIQSKIFQPFFTTKANDKGTGLGLSMVFSFIKQYEGDIEVESVVGQGTSFRIYLPRFVG